MKEKLTPMQEKIYAFIAGYIQDEGFCPTSQEIAMRTELTTQMVESHVKNIISKGWLKVNGKKFRKLELTQ